MSAHVRQEFFFAVPEICNFFTSISVERSPPPGRSVVLDSGVGNAQSAVQLDMHTPARVCRGVARDARALEDDLDSSPEYPTCRVGNPNVIPWQDLAKFCKSVKE
jgi:hypothetical protein